MSHEQLKSNFQKYRALFLRAARSSRGRDVMLYLLFVCVAFVFWFVLSLDLEVQKDFEVPVVVDDMPDDVTLIGEVPESFGVLVQGKGSQFVRYKWGKMPVMRFRFDENTVKNKFFYLSRQKIDGRLRDYFGQGVQIVNVRPDSLKLRYTTTPGRELPLHIVADVHTDIQYTIAGKLKSNHDTVKVYGVNGIPRSLKFVETEPVIANGLKDSAYIEVRVKPIEGYRIIPDKVIVTVPVEPLISRRRKVDVDIVGLPADTRLFTFPAQVEISYLVPMSSYNEDLPCRAYVDYGDIDRRRSKAKVSLSQLPSICRNITVSPDSVEYIIERVHASQK